MAVPLFFLVGAASAGWTGLLWALLCVLLTSGLSLVYLAYLTRAGRVRDPRKISQEERVKPLRVVAGPARRGLPPRRPPGRSHPPACGPALIHPRDRGLRGPRPVRQPFAARGGRGRDPGVPASRLRAPRSALRPVLPLVWWARVKLGATPIRSSRWGSCRGSIDLGSLHRDGVDIRPAFPPVIYRRRSREVRFRRLGRRAVGHAFATIQGVGDGLLRPKKAPAFQWPACPGCLFRASRNRLTSLGLARSGTGRSDDESAEA
jgi:hypothetical protein